MNEQIEKLFNQALKEFKAENEHATIVVPDPVQRHFVEQFAELIVRECAEVCRDQPNIYAMKVASDICATSIEEHFGVEE